MALKQLNVHIKGVFPLLMHNARLSDPTNEFSRAISKITAKGKKKTDADYEEMQRLEFFGGIYYDERNGVHVPSTNIDMMIIQGAKKDRKGKDATAGLFANDDAPLIYDGPKAVDELWEERAKFADTRSCGIKKTSRVMRTRPIFREWALKFIINFEDDVVNDGDIKDWITAAGRLIGLGDFRPKFGRFQVVSIS